MVAGEKAENGDQLSVTWRHFLLNQINSDEDSDGKLWDQSENQQGNSMLAHRASEASRRQGPEVFENYHHALLRARHGVESRRIPLNDRDVLLDVAEKAGVDVKRLRSNLDDPSLLGIIAKDHTEATNQFGVFGTPTFLFASGLTVYLKMFIPPSGEAMDTFEHFIGLMSDRPYLGEVKRPQPPWPKGAVKPSRG